MTNTEIKKQHLDSEVAKLAAEKGLYLKSWELDYACILQVNDDSISPEKFTQLVFEKRFRILTGMSYKKYLKQAKQLENSTIPVIY
jgi:hypothetical protein